MVILTLIYIIITVTVTWSKGSDHVQLQGALRLILFHDSRLAIRRGSTLWIKFLLKWQIYYIYVLLSIEILYCKPSFKDQFDGLFLFTKAIFKHATTQVLFNVTKSSVSESGDKNKKISSVKIRKSDHCKIKKFNIKKGKNDGWIMKIKTRVICPDFLVYAYCINCIKVDPALYKFVSNQTFF